MSRRAQPEVLDLVDVFHEFPAHGSPHCTGIYVVDDVAQRVLCACPARVCWCEPGMAFDDSGNLIVTHHTSH